MKQFSLVDNLMQATIKHSKTTAMKKVSAARKKLAITCLRAKPLYRLPRSVSQFLSSL